MRKYKQVFKISFQQEFAYRVNFILWRLRNVLQIFLVFFLWDTIFSNPSRVVFGYDKAKILTYIFGLLIVRAFVLSARAQDVAGDISNGDIINYFLKPVNYIKYWIVRDFSSKALNAIFATFEIIILFFILQPPFFIQTNPLNILGFLVSIVLAIFIYFYLLFIVNSVAFWIPEAGWGAQFLITVVATEYLSGAIFPLDVFPTAIQKVLYLTPFPYTIFYPLQIYLGKITGVDMFKGLLISFIWLIILIYFFKFIWNKGIKAYQAYGR